MTSITTPAAEDINPPLRGARVHLEPLVAGHAAAMFPLLGDPSLYTWIDHGPPASVERLHEVYRQLEGRHSPDGQEHWLNWVLQADGLQGPLGFVQASVLPDGRSWVAYLLGRAFWGQGHAADAMATLLQHLFTGLAVGQAMAMVEQDNARSVALLQRLGFHRAAGRELQGHELTATEQLWLLDRS
jgi:[ribosomal protein S5]-alanine N-acetyltransferase